MGGLTFGALVAGLQAMVEEGVCAALKGIVKSQDLHRLEPLAVEGRFPRPIRGACSPLGAWLEFDPDWEPPGERSVAPFQKNLSFSLQA